MKKILLHFGFFILLIALNVSLYQFLAEGHEIQFLNTIVIKKIFNSSFIFGALKDTPYFFRVVSVCVASGLIGIAACYFYFYLALELHLLRIGMTLFLSGIIGNSLEKIILGKVFDYICINMPGLSSFTFNLNDVAQILGFLILVKEVFHKQNVIWFPELRRKTIILYREIQLTILAKILTVCFIANLTQTILALTLLFPYIGEDFNWIKHLYLICIFGLNLFLLPALGVFLMRELLRCIGPIFALERHLNEKERHSKPFRLRENDYFKSLEESLDNFKKLHSRKD